MKKIIISCFLSLLLCSNLYSQVKNDQANENDVVNEIDVANETLKFALTFADGSERIIEVNYKAMIAQTADFEGKEVSLLNPIDIRELTLTTESNVIRSITADVEEFKAPVAFTENISVTEASEWFKNFSILSNNNREDEQEEALNQFKNDLIADFPNIIANDFKPLMNDIQEKIDFTDIRMIPKGEF